MTAMRILQIGPVPPECGGRDTGGIATHLIGLATHLAARGHDVGVIADNRGYDSGVWPAQCAAVSVYGIEDFAGPRRTAALLNPTAWRDLARAHGALAGLGSARWAVAKVAAYREVAAAFQPDIVHVHTLETRFSFADAVFRGRVPLVATVHSSHYVEFAEERRRTAHEALVRRNLAHAGHTIFVSRYLRQRYGQLFGADASLPLARVIPNPIDASSHVPLDRLASRRALGLAESGSVLLFVGNLIARKDAATLLRATAILVREGIDVTAVVVGAGPEEEALRALAEAENIVAHVRFEGAKLQTELARYYSAADLFVFPSLMESFGLVALEAMLFGLPVIGSPEVFDEVVPTRSGMQVRPQAPEALARAIADALGRSWDRAAIRAGALDFDWGSRIGAFEQAYAEIVASA